MGHRPLLLGDDDALHRLVAGQVILEVIAFSHWRQGESVIIEEDEVIRQFLDAMDVQLNDVGVIGGQVLCRQVIPVPHNEQFLMVGAQEFRHMPPGDEHDAMHPGHELLHRPEDGRLRPVPGGR